MPIIKVNALTVPMIHRTIANVIIDAKDSFPRALNVLRKYAPFIFTVAAVGDKYDRCMNILYTISFISIMTHN